jgi:hypothetical protein
MNLGARLAIAFLMPPAAMIASVWALHHVAMPHIPPLGWALVGCLILAGAVVLLKSPWPLVPKLLIVLVYAATMLVLLPTIGVAMACSYEQCR